MKRSGCILKGYPPLLSCLLSRWTNYATSHIGSLSIQKSTRDSWVVSNKGVFMKIKEGRMKADRTTVEEKRLKEARDKNIPWEKWGPYLSERQWGTVREDYSEG